MNQQREFLNETFHVLAQPITALRCTVELGLLKTLDNKAAHKVLEDCLHLIGSLMQDLAVFREIASLEEPPPLQSCQGHTLLQGCVEEMGIVAQAGGSALLLSAEPAAIQCNEPMLQRAMFILLDEMIAATPDGGEISISLRANEGGFLVEVRPGMPQGQRQKLCQKLLQFAGGHAIRFDAGCISMTFEESSCRPFPSLQLQTDKQLLTSH
jgi:signal transduction histidine kinase